MIIIPEQKQGKLKQRLTPEKLANLVNPPNNVSLSKIGQQFKTTRQRVHQILRDYKQEHPDLFLKKKDPQKEEIKEFLSQNMPLFRIARHFDISTNRLKKLMVKYGVEKAYLKDIITKEVLEDLFVRQGKSNREIAAMYNCSHNTIMKLRYTSEVYKSDRDPLKSRLTKKIFKDLYVGKNFLLKQIAEVFGVNLHNVSRLKKEYKITKSRACGASPAIVASVKISLGVI